MPGLKECGGGWLVLRPSAKLPRSSKKDGRGMNRYTGKARLIDNVWIVRVEGVGPILGVSYQRARQLLSNV
ncbi:hypothetical protein AUCHE_05_04440 [Austwickia chelonae NBRC 105200]|uniref:Uncharacterized protein n=1 Tax=Austwickia chelonae NBRC 105200 TaxID=1184607 RepID=K6W6T7_9MICO|nr:hypothetical protein AUCHE_05_04440 [Austwickia chelonae NBRC 105200]